MMSLTDGKGLINISPILASSPLSWTSHERWSNENKTKALSHNEHKESGCQIGSKHQPPGDLVAKVFKRKQDESTRLGPGGYEELLLIIISRAAMRDELVDRAAENAAIKLSHIAWNARLDVQRGLYTQVGFDP